MQVEITIIFLKKLHIIYTSKNVKLIIVFARQIKKYVLKIITLKNKAAFIQSGFVKYYFSLRYGM